MRFVNADGLIGATGGILSHNMYAYTANNPVMRIDPTGYLFWDVLDVVGFASSMIDFLGDPTLANLCWLAIDTVGLLPLLPSMGTYIKGVKYFGKVDDVGDVAKGARHLGPDEIRFTQDSISQTFKDGSSVDSLIIGLKNGTISPNDIPAIRIYEQDGGLYSLDNRRLYAFQEAGVENINYQWATSEEIINEAWKFTTENGGISVRVR